MSIDQKYKIQAIKRSDDSLVNPGKILTEEDGIFFKKTDAALLLTLDDYKRHCVELGCGSKHIEGIKELYEHLKEWQLANPEKVHLPD